MGVELSTKLASKSHSFIQPATLRHLPGGIATWDELNITPWKLMSKVYVVALGSGQGASADQVLARVYFQPPPELIPEARCGNFSALVVNLFRE